MTWSASPDRRQPVAAALVFTHFIGCRLITWERALVEGRDRAIELTRQEAG